MRKYILVVVLLSIFYSSSFCQDRDNRKRDSLKMDSLKKVLPQLKDQSRVDCMNSIAELYVYNAVFWESRFTVDSIFAYALRVNEEARRINYKDGEAKSLYILGQCEWIRKKNYDLAEEYFRRAIRVADTMHNPVFIGDTYMRLSESLYGKLRNQTDFVDRKLTSDKIFKAYTSAAKYYKQGGDLMKEGEALTWICMRHMYEGNYDEGFGPCEKALQITRQIPKKDLNFDALRWSLFNMSQLYKAVEEYETALAYLRESGQVTEKYNLYGSMDHELGDLFNLMGKYDSALYYFSRFKNDPKRSEWSKDYYFAMLVGLGDTYFLTKKYDSSLQILNEIIIGRKVDSKSRPTVRVLILQSKVYTAMKNYPMALKSAREAVNREEKQKLISSEPSIYLIDGYEVLSESYHYSGKDDLAYKYLKMHTAMKDSVDNKRALWRLKSQLNNYKKQAEEERKTSQISLLNKDNQLKEQKLKQQATLRNNLIAGIILLFLLGVFIFRSFYLKRKKQQAENEKRQTELEMQALRAQMNPHFIFNCLSSINKYILKNEPDTASDYLTRFSRLIRMVLLNSQRSLVTLEDELDMLTIYLDMERMRFKNAFNYNIIFANRVDADAIFIPPLLLQPFCENAIWHGLKPLADLEQIDHEPGRLDIVLSMDDKVLNCSITDNGIGRKKAAEIKSKSAEEKKSLGLKITAERLALLNQEKNAFTSYEIKDLEDENGNAAGTKVNLKISYKEIVEEIINN